MDKLFSFVLALLVVSFPARAQALQSGATFRAALNGRPEGSMRFQYYATVPGGACRYAVEWGPASSPADQCYLDEATWIGHQSCVENALGPMDSIIVMAPGLPCWAYDTSDQDNPLFKLVLVERGWDGGLEGLIQFSAAAPLLSGFAAMPDS